MVRYLTEVYAGLQFRKTPVQRRGFLQLLPGQSASGYGNRIATDYMVKVGNRWRRIYCICHSNVGSLYVKEGTDRLFVRDSDIPDEVRRS